MVKLIWGTLGFDVNENWVKPIELNERPNGRGLKEIGRGKFELVER
jgi:hypothetical protein